jgi:hypothetical protein
MLVPPITLLVDPARARIATVMGAMACLLGTLPHKHALTHANTHAHSLTHIYSHSHLFTHSNYGGPMKLFEMDGNTKALVDVAPSLGLDKTTGGRALVRYALPLAVAISYHYCWC